MVFTTEQRLYFLKISEKRVLWSCSRPRQLASSGDIRCCLIPGTDKIACIATGKQSLQEHFYLLVDYRQQTVDVRELPNCYRVVHALVWTQVFGLTFLTYQANDAGELLYRINALTEDGDCATLLEWESAQLVNAYSGSYLFMNDYGEQEPQLRVYPLEQLQQIQYPVLENSYILPFPSFHSEGPVGSSGLYLPTISWIDEDAGLLTACTTDWLGVYDFVDEKRIAEYNHTNISCGTIIDEKLLIGCTPGLMIEKLGFSNSNE